MFTKRKNVLTAYRIPVIGILARNFEFSQLPVQKRRNPLSLDMLGERKAVALALNLEIRYGNSHDPNLRTAQLTLWRLTTYIYIYRVFHDFRA